VPSNATERVVGQFGPGPARDVLVSLLNGSHFKNVLLGSAETPFVLDRAILTSRSSVNDQPVQAASAAESARRGGSRFTGRYAACDSRGQRPGNRGP
jgi:hypothetical protein